MVSFKKANRSGDLASSALLAAIPVNTAKLVQNCSISLTEVIDSQCLVS